MMLRQSTLAARLKTKITIPFIFYLPLSFVFFSFVQTANPLPPTYCCTARPSNVFHTTAEGITTGRGGGGSLVTKIAHDFRANAFVCA